MFCWGFDLALTGVKTPQGNLVCRRHENHSVQFWVKDQDLLLFEGAILNRLELQNCPHLTLVNRKFRAKSPC